MRLKQKARDATGSRAFFAPLFAEKWGLIFQRAPGKRSAPLQSNRFFNTSTAS